MNSTDASTPAIVDTPVAGSVGLFLDKVARRYRTALNRFFERRTLALAYDSEDLTQEVFARLAGRRDGQDIAPVEQYLFRTAQNVLIDHHRRGTEIVDAHEGRIVGYLLDELGLGSAEIEKLRGLYTEA